MTSDAPGSSHSLCSDDERFVAAVSQAVADVLRVDVAADKRATQTRSLERLAESGFNPEVHEAAAALCSFGQTRDRLAQDWIAHVHRRSDRETVEEFAASFFEIDAEERRTRHRQLTAIVADPVAKSRLQELAPAVDVPGGGPVGLERAAQFAQALFVARPTERTRKFAKASISKERWASLRSRWIEGAYVVDATTGPPDWQVAYRNPIRPIVVRSPILKHVEEEEKKDRTFIWSILVGVLLAIVGIAFDKDSSSSSNTRRTSTLDSREISLQKAYDHVTKKRMPGYLEYIRKRDGDQAVRDLASGKREFDIVDYFQYSNRNPTPQPTAPDQPNPYQLPAFAYPQTTPAPNGQPPRGAFQQPSPAPSPGFSNRNRNRTPSRPSTPRPSYSPRPSYTPPAGPSPPF